jgi:hypothetical protein
MFQAIRRGTCAFYLLCPGLRFLRRQLGHNGKNSHDLKRWGKRLAEARDLSENAGYACRLVKWDSDYLAPRKTAEHANLAGARRDWLLVDALAPLLAALVLVGVDAIASAHN